MLDQIALVDTGANLNTLTFDTWEELGRSKLVNTKLAFSSYLGESSLAKGSFELPVFLNGLNLVHKFYIMLRGPMLSPIILGKTWQRT